MKGRIITKEQKMSFGILGKVKVGDTVKSISKSGKEYDRPVSLDYFRFTSNVAIRVERMKGIYGEKPNRLPITFSSNDPSLVCNQEYELRDSAGRKVAFGNGISFYESHKTGGWVQKPDMTKAQGEKYMADLAKRNGAEWKEVLTLRFWVLGYTELGEWEFRTSGKDTSIGQIISSFDNVLENAGRVKGIPFCLTVEKHKSNRAGVNREYPVVNLICDLSVGMTEKVKQLGNAISGMITTQKLKAALPEGKTEPVSTASHPEKQETEYTEFEEVQPKPLIVIKKTDRVFNEKTVPFFFKKEADTDAVLAALEKNGRTLGEQAKKLLYGLEEWYAVKDHVQARPQEFMSKVDQAYWKYFGVEVEQVPV